MSTATARLHEAMTASPSPAVGISVERKTETVFRAVRGTADLTTGEAVTDEHQWDLASLTKSLVTTVEVLALVDDGAINLEAPLGSLLPAAATTWWAATPVWALLSHATGLPAERRFYREDLADVAAVVDAVLATAPVSASAVYSDLNFILLGELLAEVAGESLADLARRRGPLRFPGPGADGPYVATEDCPWRGRLLRGEVHDENAAVLGGVAGHAGAFGTLAGVADQARSWLTGERLPRSAALASRCWATNEEERFGLGFFLGRSRHLGGSRPGPGSFGAPGFVGNRVWVEPQYDYAVVILSNRVHPRRLDRAPFDAWSSRTMDLIAEVLRGQ